MQRQASGEQLKQISQRNNYRGYDTKPQTAKRSTAQQRENRQTTARDMRSGFRSPCSNAAPAAKQSARANALSGNDSRSANWQAQQQRGAQADSSLRAAAATSGVGGRAERREIRHR